jgi:DNA-directed RNA polymerase specialized sigma24 family protein
VFDGFVLQSKQKFYGWLRVVVGRAVLTFIRDRGRKPGAWGAGGGNAQECLNQVTEGMARELESVCDDDLARVSAARARVKERVAEKTWQAFCLLQDEQLSTDEVAHRLEISKVSVWQARSRVLRLLREELTDLCGPAATRNGNEP